MMHDWLIVSFLLAFLSLDVSAVGQFMIARPIVAGPLVGLFTGHVELGLEMGALIELIWIGDVPVGSHLPLDLLMLTGVSVAFASELVNGRVPSEAAVTYAMAVAIPLAAISTEAENLLRKFHVRWIHFAQRMVLHSHFRTFEWINSFVLAELFLKGFVVAAIGLTLAHLTLGLFSMFSGKVIEGLYYAHWLLLALGCSAVIDLLVEKKTVIYLILSIVTVSLGVFFQFQGVYLVCLMVFGGFVFTLLYMGKGEAS
jgi:mannose/fructose/N-acetylgalactosamine-specific phosphotransferase system component IIC